MGRGIPSPLRDGPGEGTSPEKKISFNFCIFWCILGAFQCATLLLDILHITEVYQTGGVSKTCWNEKMTNSNIN